jgi:hypothetical protein
MAGLVTQLNRGPSTPGGDWTALCLGPFGPEEDNVYSVYVLGGTYFAVNMTGEVLGAGQSIRCAYGGSSVTIIETLS